MENAAQALLIAGGILLAILTLSLIVYMSNNVSTIGSAQAEKQEVERLAAWNAEWEAYNKQVLYGAEVLTVRNKADQNNLEYTNVEYHVTIICTDKPHTYHLRGLLRQKPDLFYTSHNVCYATFL